MAAGDTAPGRRREDVRYAGYPDDVQPGDYWRYVDEDGKPKVAKGSLEAAAALGNLTGGIWGIVTPNERHGHLVVHTVREHEDGTISVAPGDGSTNSILCSAVGDRAGWHGYIDHGVWREV